MSTPPPPILRLQIQELLAQIERELASASFEKDRAWQPGPRGAGQGMIRLFGRFLDIIRARLNQVPQQHFRAFLSEGGIDQIPPQPATAQVLFVPEKEARESILVPAGTQVATRPRADGTEIIFETDKDIKVVPTELVSCIALDQRTWGEQVDRSTGKFLGAFPAFRGKEVRRRELYVRHDEFLTFPDAATRKNAIITLDFKLAAPEPKGEWQLEWFYYGLPEKRDSEGLPDRQDAEKKWRPLVEKGRLDNVVITDGTDGLHRDGNIQFERLLQMEKAKVNDQEGIWLKCTVTPAGDHVVHFPEIRDITIARRITVDDEQVTPALFIGSQNGLALTPIKADDAFYPFGQFPALFDGFYVSAVEVFSKPGATAELAFGGVRPPQVGDDDDQSRLNTIAVKWEYLNESGWQRLGTSRWDGKTDPDHPDQPEFRDTTCAFKREFAQEGEKGIVSFKVPKKADANESAIAQRNINEQEGRWIRAQICEDGYQVPQPPPGGILRRLFIGKIAAPPPEARPPLVRELKLTYSYTVAEGPKRPQGCLGCTDGTWREPSGWTADDAGRGADGGKSVTPFAPFTSTIEKAALYLGFSPLDTDEAKGRVAFPPTTWVELFVELDGTGDETTIAPLCWEYRTADAWRELAVVDQTYGLQRSGMVGFFGQDDHKQAAEFGVKAFWLRAWRGKCKDVDAVSQDAVSASPDRRDGTASPAQEEEAASPLIAAVRLNVAQVTNGVTLLDEVLGSSTAEKGQEFRIARPPVSPDIVLEVQEPSENAGESTSRWIPWTRVSDLVECGPTDRCYALDLAKGLVKFGNGENGAIPPAGRNNIRVKRYRSHAGQKSNVRKNDISVLRNPKDDLNDVRSVLNPAAAAGGADLEETAQVEQRGPFRLKNRGRAITEEDYRWLARDVVGVRRAYCLPTRRRDGTHMPGYVTVVVVPEPELPVDLGLAQPVAAPQRAIPQPTPELLREVRNSVAARVLVNLASPGMDTIAAGDGRPYPGRIHVTGAAYTKVSVQAKVVASDRPNADDIREKILNRLDDFLDAANGGPEGQGWEPGRDVYLSEIMAEIENVPGVDHVREAWLKIPSQQQQFLVVQPEMKLDLPVWPRLDHWLPAGSQVSTFDGRIKGVLLAELPAGEEVTEIVVGGFGDGDMVTVKRWGNHQPGWPATDRPLRISLARPDPAEGDGASLDEILFELPLDFPDETAFKSWQGLGGADTTSQTAQHPPAVVMLATTNGRVCAPVVGYPESLLDKDASGRFRLRGVNVERFRPDEPVSLVDPEHRGHRRDFISIYCVSNDSILSRGFVPEDHLVCPGQHAIEMVL